MELTSYQQSLVHHEQGHALCIAVPGSGKTSTLVHRVANLLDKGANPRRMLVMMFNKSAQIDFTQKLRKTCPQHQWLPEVRTYHSTGLRLLRSMERWGVRQPYQPKPMGEKEIELKVRDLLLQKASSSIQEKIRQDSAKYIEAAIAYIEDVKSSLSSPGMAFEESGLPKDFHFFIELFSEFEQWRHDQRALTFTDMLYDPVCLIEKHPELLARIENKMEHVIVDEYQDTSVLQHRLTQVIAGQRAKMMVVGDPDQTIYEFAGANISNILHHFESDFGQSDRITPLEMPHTFRYGHSVAIAASHLISKNRDRKNIICQAHPGNPATRLQFTEYEKDDTSHVLSEIAAHCNSANDNQLAVLVRVWAQSVPIELGLLEQGIAYTSEGPSLFDRPEIAALVSVLELAAGQLAFMGEEDRGLRLNKMLTLPHVGIKNQWVRQVVHSLQSLDQGYGKALSQYTSKLQGLSEYQQRKLQKRAELLHFIEVSAKKHSPHELLSAYIDQSGFRESLESMSLNEQRTREQLLAVDGLLAWLKGHNQSLRQCCQHIQALRQKKNAHKKNRKEKVLISSCHRAKGLEWSTVLIPGLTTRYWPFTREDELAKVTSNHMEAERRLLYVAMTRAVDHLHLFSCKVNPVKQSHFQAGPSKATVSPFLTEMQLSLSIDLAQALDNADDSRLNSVIEKRGLTQEAQRYLKQVRPDLASSIQEQLAKRHEEAKSRSKNKTISSPDPLAPWELNALVRHTILGDGKVIEVKDNSFAIDFDNHNGIKRFVRSEGIRHLFQRLSPPSLRQSKAKLEIQ